MIASLPTENMSLSLFCHWFSNPRTSQARVYNRLIISHDFHVKTAATDLFFQTNHTELSASQPDVPNMNCLNQCLFRSSAVLNSSMPYLFDNPGMSKYLKSNRQQLKNKIFYKLNLSANDDWQGSIERESTQGSHEQLDKILRQTEKRKLSIRKLINTNNVHADFSDQMAQLRWRIDALKNFGRGEKEKLLAHNTNSLTGKDQSAPPQLTFDELYELQKRKFAMLRERRKTKASDPKYVEMIGNMQLRKEKRKSAAKGKLDQQMRTLNNSLEQPLE